MQNENWWRLGRLRFNKEFACFDFEFLVALEGIFLSSDSPFSLLWFSFTKLDREALFYVILVLFLSVCLSVCKPANHSLTHLIERSVFYTCLFISLLVCLCVCLLVYMSASLSAFLFAWVYNEPWILDNFLFREVQPLWTLATIYETLVPTDEELSQDTQSTLVLALAACHINTEWIVIRNLFHNQHILVMDMINL